MIKLITDKFIYQEDKNVYGLTKELNAQYILNYFKQNDNNTIVLTNSLYEANNFYKMIRDYEEECLLFPMDDFLTSVAIAVSPDFKIKRLEVLDSLKKNPKKKHLIITSLMGYLKFLPNIKEESKFTIDPSPSNISREIILEKLDAFGYKRESLVTTTGEYAVRGYIIDIFPVGYSHPVRLEFFDQDVETIKEFDENTQLTTSKLKNVVIKRIEELNSDNPSSLLDYAKESSLFLVDESQIKSSYESLLKEMFEYRVSKDLDKNTKFMYDLEELKPSKIYKINTLNSYKTKDAIAYDTKDIVNFNSNLANLKSYCLKEIKKKTIIFVLKNDKQIKIIKELLPDANITNADKIIDNRINIISGTLNKGFIFDKYIFISPYDIDNVQKKDIKYKNTIKIGRKIKSFNDLYIGDYIVHETYGIGVYNGLKTLKNSGYEKDYIELKYLDNDKVYIPVENISILYKYTDKDGIKPKINRLNSTSWAKKKLETRKKIRDISGELLELYTSRSQITCTPYKDYDEEIEFALNFPFTLTEDQEKTIKEINYDLKTITPMDRLLCGDVGYGKTEVAFRGMFKTVINNHQVAYLCPTTILSRQQYNSAVERFKDFPVKIKLLNRHTTPKEVKEILEGLEKGTIDIVIGTHKLLNKKIKYKNLGLLVIDEEQRFGVTHKEKIKEIKTDVNVLTLSATPIPRTLKMAMSGLRSLSVLDTPPVNRYPIQTYVIEESELIIRDAIYKEMTRNGQVFILVNNIEEMLSFANKLKELIPEANIISAHGKMSSEEMNSVMDAFIQGEYDILVCTTIIETGIDIPNVNTIIILDSDKFGLSQLYQIRGRVGRSDKIAYAYLMYNPAKILTETATRRLNSIKEFTELGSGYKIAMRDLSIRGAGDLLGREQAGFIDAVGLDLYTRMVEEEVRRLKGEEVEEEQPENNSAILNIQTHIDDGYVQDENIKIEIHKLINTIKSKEDYLSVKAELEDRFGKIDENIEIYMLEKCIESIVKNLGISNIIQEQRKLTIALPEDVSNKIDGEKLFLEVYNINPKFNLSYRNKMIYISLITDNLKKNYIYYIFDLLNVINNQISRV